MPNRATKRTQAKQGVKAAAAPKTFDVAIAQKQGEQILELDAAVKKAQREIDLYLTAILSGVEKPYAGIVAIHMDPPRIILAEAPKGTKKPALAVLDGGGEPE